MDQNSIGSAVYSNVPVLEITIKGIPMMRRRKDDWMNATQILKVAGFDKPQRTRILEREVQKGEHEKVQGGYGKYQGTWIPFARGLELATQYEVADIMQPILSYRQGSQSPPPAPKHTTAASKPAKQTLLRGPRKLKPTPRKQTLETARARPSAVLSSEMSDASIEDLKSDRSASPDRTDISIHSDLEDGVHAIFSDQYVPGQLQISGYSEKLLEFFTDPKRFSMPEFLRAPPPDYDANATIDDEGHSALHWASAMGLLDVVAYLKRAGADISCGNHESQTPFMRVVAFCNNYDLKTFPEIIQQLIGSAHISDNHGRTVFHHISMSTSAPAKSKIMAARYYMDQLLNHLTQSMSGAEFKALIDHRDHNGDTALTMAARNGVKKVWKSLLEYNANPHILNKDGRSAQEYIDAHEASKRQILPSSSPIHPAALDRASSYSTTQISKQYLSEAAIRTTHKVLPEITEKLKLLASAYDAEFHEREEDVKEAQTSLSEMHNEMELHRVYLRENPAVGMAKMIETATEQEIVCRDGLYQVVERSQAAALKELVRVEESSSSMKQEDVTDLTGLITELEALQEARKSKVREIVNIMGSSGLGPRMNDYRKLISIASGGDIPPEDLDDIKLAEIEETLTSADEGLITEVLLSNDDVEMGEDD
ncbi:Cell division cycle-related protein res2/pct1 [Taphrina deformans PYCC 5710]|uniref:Cell division cycle-related protein res2/pct1 n=1 Tax=Taphrina deformans (strain PYCC 5710 / ATCC 11124 / CBS 356.35 / IMI 108563 / JCM 9778 / NBRC 8474) TaxID=1097556 RepID=R4XB24_TAPDE|nr:Cell division cycle-related protein res2/pct1 [Taphrina deformans PYCC 5710]|eukprot:CCG81528.1 Cell division cycle-related protein res2/pct1 [Taphrina deformans PYCC 5710]